MIVELTAGKTSEFILGLCPLQDTDDASSSKTLNLVLREHFE